MEGKVDADIWESYDRGTDVSVALAYARFLPWRGEYDYLADVTDRVLRRADIWAAVMHLAAVLEEKGDMEEFDGLLPFEAPGWPSSPRAREKREPKELATGLIQ